jgi:aldose 1-epimerase
MKRNIYGMRLLLSCDKYLPVDSSLIPTGELRSVQGTDFDFTAAAADEESTYGRKLGSAIPNIDGGGQPGIDHCFVVNQATSLMKHIATLTDEASGRQMIVEGTQPGVQIYTGNFLSLDAADNPYTQHNAICLETQAFPDSINQASFPSVILNPGEEYSHQTVFSFYQLS